MLRNGCLEWLLWAVCRRLLNQPLWLLLMQVALLNQRKQGVPQLAGCLVHVVVWCHLHCVQCFPTLWACELQQDLVVAFFVGSLCQGPCPV